MHEMLHTRCASSEDAESIARGLVELAVGRTKLAGPWQYFGHIVPFTPVY